MSECSRANNKRLHQISGLAQNAPTQASWVLDPEAAGMDPVAAQERYDLMVAEIKRLAAEL